MSLSLKTLNSIIAYTGSSADFILYGNDEPNSYIKKIDRMLNHCSDSTLELIYNLIHDIHKFNKNLKNQQ